jgi:hypothetical protein
MAEAPKPETLPVGELGDHYEVAAAYKDPVTGALYVHSALAAVAAPWAEEAHLSPAQAAESFGDVESFAAYVNRYATPANTLVTWWAGGIRAVLDYHLPEQREAGGRRQWTAQHPFSKSPELMGWEGLANGRTWSQADTVLKLEELADTITAPPAGDLRNLLRKLSASAKFTGDTEVRPDGTTNLVMGADKRISIALPEEISIGIPVLWGHTDEDGRPIPYGLQVRLLAVVDDKGGVGFRLYLRNADRALELAYAAVVARAQGLLAEFPILRASGG